MTLEGRVALVTGAAGRGMGRSIALTLARDGADVVVNYRSSADAARAVAGAIESMGRRALPLRADVSDPGEVAAMFERASSELGAVSIVVNSAGGPWRPRDITEIEPETLRAVLAREVEATYYLLRSALPAMRQRGWGRFISIGGHMADEWRFGPPEAPLDYPLGKAARHWLTRTIAPREAAYGITVNAVAPGPTPHVDGLDEVRRQLEGRRGGSGNRPQDIAEVVAFLCSDAASRVTGAVIPVPGERPV